MSRRFASFLTIAALAVCALIIADSPVLAQRGGRGGGKGGASRNDFRGGGFRNDFRGGDFFPGFYGYGLGLGSYGYGPTYPYGFGYSHMNRE